MSTLNTQPLIARSTPGILDSINRLSAKNSKEGREENASKHYDEKQNQ